MNFIQLIYFKGYSFKSFNPINPGSDNFIMKKYIPVLLAIFSTYSNLFAQSSSFKTTLDATVYVLNFSSAKVKARDFIRASASKVINERESKASFHVEFDIQESSLRNFDSLLTTLGYTTNRELKTVNYSEKIGQLKVQKDYLKNKIAAYNAELGRPDIDADHHYRYWEQVRNFEEEIFKIDQDIASSTVVNSSIMVYLDLVDEITSPTGTKVSFVNMPGVEYSLLRIENPEKGISGSLYRGVLLKYMFTKGKSYVTLGAYKDISSNALNDSARIQEMFQFGFGQDFYPKHFGRGSRKFFNLYTGYSVGGFFATSNTRSQTIANLNAYFGVEIFKSRHVLIDNRVGYFVPLTYNRNLRGLLYNASFNFVF